ncbi:2-oxo-4-hydroxy-4-carboxy-5-ureidoimidazoline decarboxylase [Actinomadura formosensis]|uniref:2-oxo-4-hydroxy-4-carboxy-5-ureidoimidazoline decarboxylase n=1 Tax=Actinomadura formosensis TaxID=60706 RepID=UPI001F5FC61B|nr:2-oxo-4-hydroxy-4-carboxy-5-ureidoimidazoline decarboxylase [Actinomadura formosensis]
MELSEADLAACCASRRWIAAVAGQRDLDAVRAVSKRVLDELEWADVEEALAAHPRIGERMRGDAREAGWSRGEQSGMAGAAREVRDALVEGNRAYEERFGHVFLIRASGRSALEMLVDLRERLGNDARTEREVVRRELAEIVDLRLARLGAKENP